MTPKQQEIVTAWQGVGRRFNGFFPSDNGAIVVSIMERPIELNQPAPPCIRFKYAADGELLQSSYYPNVLTANTSA